MAEVPVDAATFYAAEYPRLVGALGLYVGSADVAEELAQEAFVRVCGDWARVSRLESPGGWTWHVARNLASSHLRRRNVRQRVERRLCTRESDANAEVDHAEQLAVRAAVAELPRRQKEAIILRYYMGYSAEEAAGIVRSSPDALRALTKRGVAKLREQFGAQAQTAKGVSDGR